MRPTCEQILKTVATALALKVSHTVATDKARANLGLTALLLGVFSEEFDRSTAWRVDENQELRGLFTQAASVVRNDGLRRRLEEASRGREQDYRISALDRENCRLRELLIELHVYVEETMQGDAVRALEASIWRILENGTRRRSFLTSEFFTQVMLMSAEHERDR